MTHQFFIGILIISSFVSNTLAADPPSCDSGWEAIAQNKKCVRVMDTEKPMDFDEAEKACNGFLLSIHNKQEQDDISNLLFKTKKIVENVWLGLKRSGETFEWSDGSAYDYKNWMSGAPSNRSDRKCVQMSSDTDPPGQWTDGPCAKKNYAVCLKIVVNNDVLVQMILGIKKKLDKANDYLNYLTNDNYMKFDIFKNKEKKQKAFFIPSKNFSTPVSWNDANKQCKNFNDASLVELDSSEKEFLFFSYLGQLGSRNKSSNNIWLNGKRDPSGKWIWINSGQEISKPNWNDGKPKNSTGMDYLAMSISHDANFGKVSNNFENTTYLVTCEMFVNF